MAITFAIVIGLALFDVLSLVYGVDSTDGANWSTQRTN
jgi:hypothetical protein